MADNELLIKLNADAANATKAFDDVKSKTEDLESKLSDVAKISAVAFAAFTAEVAFAVKAFEEAEQASRQLNNALQNQGIYTKQLEDNYKGYAAEVERVTGLDGDAVVAAQATAQAYLGQTKITKELTQAIADYAEFKKIDLNSAAEILSKTIGTETNVLARQGLQLDATASEAEKYAKVIEFVNLKAGGLAEAANQGIGGLRGLQTQFGNFQEAIGARFAPLVGAVIEKLTALFSYISSNPALADVTVAVLAATGVLAGLGIAIPIVVSAFTTLTAAMAAFGIASNVALVGIPALIGAIVAGVTLLALNFDKVKEAAFSIGAAIKAFFSTIAEGVKIVGEGIADLNFDKIKEGLGRVTDAAAEANKARLKANAEFLAAKEAQEAEAEQKQDASKKAAADKEAAQERAKNALKLEIQRTTNEVLRLQNEQASAELIQAKQAELQTLQALQQTDNETQKQLLRDKLAQQREIEAEERAFDQEQKAALREEELAARAELNAQDIEIDTQLRAEQRAALQADLLTNQQAERKVLEDTLKARIENRNLELQDRIKYGQAVAAINAALRSDEVQGVKSASAELVQLQNSKNQTLKTIGKAAAVSQIAIATAESAMNIYRGFSTIPIIGPALGIAGAAAAVAFGAERTGNVLAAADGGLVTGGIPGVDSVPSLLMPGELVVPERNFDQVVGAVRGENQPVGRDDEIVELLSEIKDKQIAGGNTIIQGDVTTDESYIDSLVKRISDALEFRNARLYGVNT